MLSRRSFVATGGAACTLAALGFPDMAFARAATDRRFVFIIQRGAADGLHIVAPTGDPAYAGLRGDFAQDLAKGTKLGASSRSTRRSPRPPRCTPTSRLYSSTPSPRPIATARISTGRTCSRPADRPPTGCATGG